MMKILPPDNDQDSDLMEQLGRLPRDAELPAANRNIILQAARQQAAINAKSTESAAAKTGKGGFLSSPVSWWSYAAAASIFVAVGVATVVDTMPTGSMPVAQQSVQQPSDSGATETSPPVTPAPLAANSAHNIPTIDVDPMHADLLPASELKKDPVSVHAPIEQSKRDVLAIQAVIQDAQQSKKTEEKSSLDTAVEPTSDPE